jgi:hypothetical protein
VMRWGEMYIHMKANLLWRRGYEERATRAAYLVLVPQPERAALSPQLERPNLAPNHDDQIPASSRSLPSPPCSMAQSREPASPGTVRHPTARPRPASSLPSRVVLAVGGEGWMMGHEVPNQHGPIRIQGDLPALAPHQDDQTPVPNQHGPPSM